MCGIVGMVGDIPFKYEKMFEDMLVFNMVRGSDSTGIFSVNSYNNEVTMDKDTVDPYTLIYSHGSPLFMSNGTLKIRPKVLVGHGRSATIGKVNVENAHPFQYDHVTGVHNGTLRNMFRLECDKDHPVDVDSKAIFYHVAKRDAESMWKNLEGDAALVWWDGNEDSLKIIRNKGRPLQYCFSEDSKVMFFASEIDFVIVAANRRGVALRKTAEGKLDVASFPVDTLFTISVDKNNINIKEAKLEAFVPKPLPTYRTVDYDNYYERSLSGGGTAGVTRSLIAKASAVFKGNDWKLKDESWARDLVKADKTTRELVFKHIAVVANYNGAWYHRGICTEAPHEGREIRIHPNGNVKGVDCSKLFLDNKKNYGDDVEFVTTARCRTSAALSNGPLHIGADNVSLLEDYVNDDWNVDDSIPFNFEEGGEYPTPSGKMSQKDWINYLSNLPSKGCCEVCNSLLFSDDADKIKWVNDRHVICPTCLKDPTVLDFYRINHGVA